MVTPTSALPLLQGARLCPFSALFVDKDALFSLIAFEMLLQRLPGPNGETMAAPLVLLVVEATGAMVTPLFAAAAS